MHDLSLYPQRKVPSRAARTLWVMGLAVLCVNIGLLYFGVPLGFLDGRILYSVDQAYAVFEQQGIHGRQAYRWLECVDLAFIALYGSFFFGLSKAIARNLGLRRTLVVATIAMVTCDLIETGGILVLLNDYSLRHDTLGRVVSICTPLKWASFVVIFLGTARAFFDRARGTSQCSI